MITKEQCRAARSFLGIKQTELAADCGLSKTAITHFESGLFNPRADNMTAIQTALERRGIEFVGTHGVQKRQVNFQVLNTRDDETAHPRLWDDIFETMKDRGGEVLISHVNEKAAFDAHPEKLNAHIKRLHAYNIKERLLVCENDGFFIQDPSCYRWLKGDVFRAGITTFLYGGKMAQNFWKGNFILIVDHPEIYSQEIERFEYLWDTGIIPPKS